MPISRFLILALVVIASLNTADARHDVFIEAYPGSSSVKVGEVLNFHISANVGEVDIEATRIKGLWNTTVLKRALPVTVQPVTAEQPWRTGADWPVAYSFVIPADWVPGLYDFRVHSTANGDYFVRFQVAVQPAEFGDFSKIVVLTNDSTGVAYNDWGGKSNYVSHTGDGRHARVVAFNRPGVHNYRTIDWRLPAWLSQVGIPFEYVTSLQLHYESGLLDAYDVLVLAGHSEYWSREMRAALEQFLERGGKLISLSGNTMWASVRFRETPAGFQMISCKNWHDDPDCPADDPDLYTGYWHEMPNPESRVLGASWRFGGYVDAYGFYTAAEGYGGYFAEWSKHWLWAGTGVLSGDHVGQVAGIAGYEADAPPLVISAFGRLIIDPRAKDLPAGIQLLASTPAATENWEGNGAIIYFPYGDNGGEVFNCGSVDCAEGLFSDPVWRKAILNVFTRFVPIEKVLMDYDVDGVDDANDNCIAFPNPDQLDSFSDGTGDVCDQHCH